MESIKSIVEDIKAKGEVIVFMKFGSHLYGTNTPESDTDYKGVYLPNLEDVILGKTPKSSISVSTGDKEGKNSKEDIDCEFFHLKGFLKLCEEGQVCALDMLFAPEDMIIETSPIWDEIIKNRNKLLHKNTAAFVGYCRKQASKYGIKGSRLNALCDGIEFFSGLDGNTKIGDCIDGMASLLDNHREYFKLDELDIPPRNIGGGCIKNPDAMKYVETCGRKFMYTTAVKTVLPTLIKIQKEYGHRAELAKNNEGVDWKAISHAVRCCYQAIELLNTGRITMPLVEAEKIKQIKTGLDESGSPLAYLPIGEELEDLMHQVEEAKENSKLPEKADREWMDECLVQNHLEEIYASCRKFYGELW